VLCSVILAPVPIAPHWRRRKIVSVEKQYTVNVVDKKIVVRVAETLVKKCCYVLDIIVQKFVILEIVLLVKN